MATSPLLRWVLESHSQTTSSSKYFRVALWTLLSAPSRGGTSVLVTRVDPLQEKPMHGRVLSQTSTQLRISFQKLFALDGQQWRYATSLATRNADRDHQGWISASRELSTSACAMRSRSYIKIRVLSKKIIRIPRASSSSWEPTCAMSSFVHFRRQMTFMNRGPSRQQMMLRMQPTTRWITHGRLKASMGAYLRTICGSKVGQRDIRVSTQSG